MSLLDVLKDMIPDEIIGDSNVENTAEIVELDIAYSPIVEHFIHDQERLIFDIPRPTKINKRDDGNYEIRRTDPPDFRIITEKETKVMRARFLLLKGFYADKMDLLSYPHQQEVIALYFPGGFLDIKKLFAKPNEAKE